MELEYQLRVTVKFVSKQNNLNPQRQLIVLKGLLSLSSVNRQMVLPSSSRFFFLFWYEFLQISGKQDEGR